jgi:hypothetical protein
MTFSSPPSTVSSKRKIEDAECGCAEAANIVPEVRSHRGENELDRNRNETEGGMEVQKLAGNNNFTEFKGWSRPLSENNPETWTTGDLDELFEALEGHVKEPAGAQPHPQVEPTPQQEIQMVDDWNMNEGAMRQEITTAGQGTNPSPACPGLDGEHEESVPEDSRIQIQHLAISFTVPDLNCHEVYKPGHEAHPPSQPQVPASTDPHDDFLLQCRNELDRQDRVLNQLLSGPNWDQVSPFEKHQLIKEKWVAKAQQYERDLSREFGINPPRIDHDSFGKAELLHRQSELLNSIFIRNSPVPPNSTFQASEEHQKRATVAVTMCQISALRSWTADWEQELNHRRMIGSDAPLLGAKSPDLSTVSREEWDTIFGTDWQQSSLDLTHTNPVRNEFEQPSVQPAQFFAPGRMLPLPQGLILPTIPLPYPQIPFPNPAVAFGAAPPHNSNMEGPTAAATNSGTYMRIHKEKRGAPRQRMFPSMPKTDVPLSARALIDDGEVLIRFPEHLCLPEVMQRFVRPVGSHHGIWPTDRMVDFLMRHKNAKDFAGITRAERRANLKRWVTKERDACNNKARRRLESGKRSVKEATLASAEQNGPASMSQSVPASTRLQAVSEPQCVYSAHPALPSLQNSFENSRLTVAAFPGQRYDTAVPPAPQAGPIWTARDEGVI